MRKHLLVIPPWAGALLVIALFFVGGAVLLRAYGTNAPSALGHSASEIGLNGSDAGDLQSYFDSRLSQLEALLNLVLNGQQNPWQTVTLTVTFATSNSVYCGYNQNPKYGNGFLINSNPLFQSSCMKTTTEKLNSFLKNDQANAVELWMGNIKTAVQCIEYPQWVQKASGDIVDNLNDFATVQCTKALRCPINESAGVITIGSIVTNSTVSCT